MRLGNYLRGWDIRRLRARTNLDEIGQCLTLVVSVELNYRNQGDYTFRWLVNAMGSFAKHRWGVPFGGRGNTEGRRLVLPEKGVPCARPAMRRSGGLRGSN